MAVVVLNTFRTHPGRLADHLAHSEEAIGHLRRLGLQAFNVQAISGTEVGTISTSLNFADNAAYAAGYQKVMADPHWQEFWGRVTADPSAEQIESSVFSDLDPAFQPPTDRPLGVVVATQWRPYPGRAGDFLGNVTDSMPHIQRLGGSPRHLQSIIGRHPLTAMVSIGFADLDAYGEYSDKLAVDEQWQNLWLGIMANPSAELIRSGLYLNISG